MANTETHTTLYTRHRTKTNKKRNIENCRYEHHGLHKKKHDEIIGRKRNENYKIHLFMTTSNLFLSYTHIISFITNNCICFNIDIFVNHIYK